MKKTLQSKLTAALFAAALSSGTGGAFSPQANAIGSEADITTVPQTTYGPPAMTTTDTTMTTTESLVFGTETPTVTTPTTTESLIYGTETPTVTTPTTTESLIYGTETPTVTTPTTTEELMVGGVVPISVAEGDADCNFCIDARDLTVLKQFVLQHNSTQADGGDLEPYDVNRDGMIDKEDVKALVRLLTGKPEGEEEQTEPIVTTTTTFISESEMTQTSYGPPPAWD